MTRTIENPEQGKMVDKLTIGLSLEGTEEIKSDLKEIEDYMDRIIEKYTKIQEMMGEEQWENLKP